MAEDQKPEQEEEIEPQDIAGLPEELEDIQPELFSAGDLPVGRELLVGAERQLERYPLEQVKANRARYEGIVQAIAEGMGVRRICRVFKCSPHVVASIRERDPELIATEKGRWIKALGRVQWLCVDKLQEDLEAGRLPGSQVSVPLGIVTDKRALAEGGATQVVEVRHQVDPAAVAASFRQLIGAPSDTESPGEVIELEAIEATEPEATALDTSRAADTVKPESAGDQTEVSADAGTQAAGSAHKRPSEGGGGGADASASGQAT